MAEMTESAEFAEHQGDHHHRDVSGGALRAATFGAMDGLVTNIALVAGVAFSALGYFTMDAVVSGIIKVPGARAAAGSPRRAVVKEPG